MDSDRELLEWAAKAAGWHIAQLTRRPHLVHSTPSQPARL